MKNTINVNQSLIMSTEEIRMATNHLDDQNYHLSVSCDDMRNIVIDPKDEDDHSEYYIVYDFDDHGNIIPKTFADILEEKNISGYRLAKETDIPQQTIQSWTSGARNILKAEWMTVLTVCNYLGYTAEEFYKRLT
jgi:hypothetical protein